MRSDFCFEIGQHLGYFVEGQILRDQHIGHHTRFQTLVQLRAMSKRNCRFNDDGVTDA